MLRIDFYVQQLMKHQANGVRLVSEMPVTFHFDAGDRQSNKPIDHDLIVEMVREATPPQALQELQSQGRCAFVHDSEAGMRVQVEVRTAGPTAWALLISPARAARTAPADVESIPFPPPRRTATSASPCAGRRALPRKPRRLRRVLRLRPPLRAEQTPTLGRATSTAASPTTRRPMA
jgi:hypothetical protein